MIAFIHINIYMYVCMYKDGAISFTRHNDHPTEILKKIMIVFFTNLMHKFFILIHLLHSSTCFEHYCARLQEDNCISTASGIVTVFR